VKEVMIEVSGVGMIFIIECFVYDCTHETHKPIVGIEFFKLTVQETTNSVTLEIWSTAE
jgi:hypothetical protein